MIGVHQKATLLESFEGDRSRVIDNRCKVLVAIVVGEEIDFECYEVGRSTH